MNKIVAGMLLALSAEAAVANDYYDLDSNLSQAEAHLQAGELTQAVFALERALALQPDSLAALKLKLQAHLQLNERDEAWKVLSLLRQHPNYQAQRSDIAELETATRLKSNFYIGYRLNYESNLNAGPDVNEIYVPVLDDLFNVSGTEEKSGVRNMIYAGGRFDYRQSDDLSIRSRLNLLVTEDSVNDRYIANVDLGAFWELSTQEVGARFNVTRQAIDDNGDHTDINLVGQYSTPISLGGSVEATAGIKRLDYDHLDSLDQTFMTAGVGYIKPLGTSTTIDIAYENWHSIDASSGDTVLIPAMVPLNRTWEQGYDQHKLSLKVNHKLARAKTLSFSVQYFDKRYNHADPGIGQHRHDKRTQYKLEYGQVFMGDLQFNAGLTYSYNDSNYALVDYRKKGAYLGLTKLF